MQTNQVPVLTFVSTKIANSKQYPKLLEEGDLMNILLLLFLNLLPVVHNLLLNNEMKKMKTAICYPKQRVALKSV